MLNMDFRLLWTHPKAMFDT